MTSSAATSATRVRMSPDQRREQLLDLGVRLLSSRSLEEVSIEVLAEEAGISRGLLYHYFGNKQDFHRAVVRRAADDLIAITAPDSGEDLAGVLLRSLEAYVDYVCANRPGYLSLVRAAAGGDERLREIYEEARAALTDRLFTFATVPGGGREGITALGYADTPAIRLAVRGWSALSETMVLAWSEAPQGVSKAQLLDALFGSLFGALDAAR